MTRTKLSMCISTHTIYATIDDSHKAQYVHQHTHTIYFTESARTHTHTPYILQKARAHAHTYTPQSSIADTSCEMRAPHRLQSLLRFLCSCAEASTCKGQGMDSLLAQRSMIRAKKSMHIGSIVCRTLCIVTATFATSANERSLPPASSGPAQCRWRELEQTSAENQCPAMPAMQLPPARL